ncbi:hypothetical protein AB0B25_11745 [Nocardia sp. NPDC049190]|uniref:hypothetical protein n=1 Tax=Nocardia sp. NPDC049190 TaxID=3155650 RepID=UPI00340DE9F8
MAEQQPQFAVFGGLGGARIPADPTAETATGLLHPQGGPGAVRTTERLVIPYHVYTRLAGRTSDSRSARFDGDLRYLTADDQTDDTPARTHHGRISGHVADQHVPIRHKRMTEPEALGAIGHVLTKDFDHAPSHLDLTPATRSRS